MSRRQTTSVARTRGTYFPRNPKQAILAQEHDMIRKSVRTLLTCLPLTLLLAACSPSDSDSETTQQAAP
jgi:hypothetical protein